MVKNQCATILSLFLLMMGSAHAAHRHYEHRGHHRPRHYDHAAVEAPRQYGPDVWKQTGKTSFYDRRSSGSTNADGTPFNENAATIAHRDLPLGTEVAVTDNETGQTERAIVRDRGPFIGSRICDVSKGLARRFHRIADGVWNVTIRRIATPEQRLAENQPSVRDATIGDDARDEIAEAPEARPQVVETMAHRRVRRYYRHHGRRH